LSGNLTFKVNRIARLDSVSVYAGESGHCSEAVVDGIESLVGTGKLLKKSESSRQQQPLAVGSATLVRPLRWKREILP